MDTLRNRVFLVRATTFACTFCGRRDLCSSCPDHHSERCRAPRSRAARGRIDRKRGHR